MSEVLLPTLRSYGSVEDVVVRVRRRGERLTVDDAGAAVRLAGHPQGWHARAERIVAAYGLNVSRQGVVFVPAVGDHDLDRLVGLVSTTSLEVYDALLDDEF